MNAPKAMHERLTPEAELVWLRKVVDADSARLSALRAENRQLRNRIQELERAAAVPNEAEQT